MAAKKTVVYLALVVLSIIWAGSFVAAKVVLNEGVSPTLLAFLRFLLTVFCYLPFLFVKNKPPLIKQDMSVFIGLGLSGITLYFIAQFSAVKLAGASTTALIVTLIPLGVALASFFILKESLSQLKLLGFLLSGLGAFSIMLADFQIPAKVNFEYFLGVGWAFSNVILWTVYTLISKKIVQRYVPFWLTYYTVVFGTCMLIPFVIFDTTWLVIFQLSWSAWLGILYLAVLSTMIGYWLWNWSLRQINASQAAVFIYLEPLFTLVIAFFMLGELFNYLTLLSALLIITGVYLVNKVDD